MPVIGEPQKSHSLQILSILFKWNSLRPFAHPEEDVHSKHAKTFWKHGDLYKKLIIIIGGFHALRVWESLIYKRHQNTIWKCVC